MKKQPSKVAHNSQLAIFFITGLVAQKAHFTQKYEFYRLSVPPLYNLLAWTVTRGQKKENKSRHPRKLALRAFVYTCVFNKTHTHK